MLAEYLIDYSIVQAMMVPRDTFLNGTAHDSVEFQEQVRRFYSTIRKTPSRQLTSGMLASPSHCLRAS